MSNTFFNASQNSIFARGLVGSLTGKAIFPLGTVIRHFRRVRTNKILRSLSEEQLKDVGIDQSLIHKGPKVEVEARLMNTLMSLR